ncbi:hypothetical protein JZU46_01820 [bacterium]|jgi:hypothetical protein|nr:hypothetical protein [bacterium]
MLQKLIYGNTTFIIEDDEFKRDFNQKFQGRFRCTSIHITHPKPGVSLVNGTARIIDKSQADTYIFGLNVVSINFPKWEVQFNMSPSFFSCVREALVAECLQERKQS